MRKRRSSRGDVLIDLTSLLDVMFIILLVTLWGRHATEDTLKETQVATENAKAQLEAAAAMNANDYDRAPKPFAEKVKPANVLCILFYFYFKF